MYSKWGIKINSTLIEEYINLKFYYFTVSFI